ncbi:MAG: hypothetical protein OEW21_05825 [Betaproteobacteria bacterium]|nr:hypothetical protein [Betaproteobacteria bacterium]
MSGLAACGGGGASSSANNTGGTGTTISSVSPAGIVVAATPATVSLTGNNFAAGMTIAMSSSLGTTRITPTSVTSTSMVVSVPVSTLPSGNYVTLSVMPASGGAALASAILGVAGTARTLAADIQAIFDNAGCTSCHAGAVPSGGLDLTGGSSAAALINRNSVGCATRFRVTPGDPRRSSSVLVDKIQARSSGVAACSGNPMPPPGSTLGAQDIQAIIDWVAGGAN